MSCWRAIGGKPRRSAVSHAGSGSALNMLFSRTAPRSRAAVTYSRNSCASSTDAHSLVSSAPLLDNPLSRRGWFNYAVQPTNSSGLGCQTLECGRQAYEQLGAAGAAQEDNKAGAPISQRLLQAV